MTELAVAYVSIAAETSKMPGQIADAVKQGGRGAESVGRGMGSKIASGLGSTLKAGALAAGAIAGLALSTALTQGMKRLTAIDDAKGKLAGLGHDAQSVAAIMDSALIAVKGTAFGLGEAATTAASAVAAGIKPGQELAKYLTLTADAATIAGTSLEDMGAIVNKVQNSGKAFTDDLNQLSDRGIPIFQWLQKEYGVSGEALSKMVSDGKVDAETFKRVIEQNIGGAAQSSGKTLKGSIANMKAAFGRLGEGILTPFLTDSKGGLGKFTEFIDKITPKAKALSQGLHDGLAQMAKAFKSSGDSIDGAGTKWERFGATARKITDGVRGVYSILAQGDFKGAEQTFGLQEDSKVVDILFRIREAATKLFDVLRNPSTEGFKEFTDAVKGPDTAKGLDASTDAASSLGDALGKIGPVAKDAGVSLIDLAGNSGAVLTTAIKGLSSIMGFFADHTGAATVALSGLAAAFALAQTAETAFHIARVIAVAQVPAQLLVQRQLIAALGAHTAALQANTVAQGGNAAAASVSRLAQLGIAAAHFRASAAAAASSTSLAAFAASQRTAAAASGGLAGALRTGVAGVANFGARVQGVASTGLSALRTGASTLASALGGPVVLGLAAATIGLVAFNSASDTLNSNFEANRTSASRFAQSMVVYRQSLDEAFSDSGGTTDRGVSTVVTGQIQAIDDEIEAARKRTPSLWQAFVAETESSLSFGLSDASDNAGALNELGKQAGRAEEQMASLGITTKDIAGAVTGSTAQWNTMRAAMVAAGGDTSIFVKQYDEARRVFVESQSSANQIRDAFLGIKEGALGASDGVGAMTSALARLRGDATSVDDAQQQVNAAMRTFADAAKEGGIATADAAGNINTVTAAGSGLRDAVKGVATAFDTAGAAAAAQAASQQLSAEDTAAAVEAAGQRVRDEFIAQAVAAGKPLAEATALADQYKLFPKDLATQIKLAGAPEAAAQLAELTKPATKVITISTFDPTTGNAGTLTTPDRPGLGNFAPRAEGGALTGGVPGKDSIPILGMPGEHMLDTDDVDRLGGQGGVYRFRAALKAGVVGKFKEGGAVERALGAASSATGIKYLWGGTTPAGFDCSGFIGYLQQILMGIAAPTKRLYTTMSLLAGNTAGLVRGAGSVGTMFRVGVSNEHMAGTLAGRPVESGGSHGDSRLGPPAVGADDGQFGAQFYLPNNLIAGGAGGAKVDWSGADEIDLERARLAVDKAKAAQAELANKPDTTELERRDADLDVRDAEDKVTTLENKKAGIGSEFDTTAPDAADSKDSTDKKEGFTVKGRLRDFITEAAGIGFDALTEQLPFGLGESRWLTMDYSQFAKNNPDTEKALSDKPASFPQDDVADQLGFNPAKGVPDWAEQLRKTIPFKLFDTGGVMNPGDIGINLLKKPEVWLNPAEKANVERIANLRVMPMPSPASNGYDGPPIVVNANGYDPSAIGRDVANRLGRAQMRYAGRSFTPA